MMLKYFQNCLEELSSCYSQMCGLETSLSTETRTDVTDQIPVVRYGRVGSRRVAALSYTNFLVYPLICIRVTKIANFNKYDNLVKLKSWARGDCETETSQREDFSWSAKISADYVQSNFFSNYLFISSLFRPSLPEPLECMYSI